MTTDPQAPVEGGKAESQRLGIRSIKEVSDQRDEELAVIFREMRRASGITQEQMAGRLATSVSTVGALETGALSDLPEWPELKRVVTTYAAQLGLDARPILRRMQGQLGVADNETASLKQPAPSPPPSPAPPSPKPPAAQTAPLPKPPAARSGPPMPPSVGAPAPSPVPPAPAPVPPPPPIPNGPASAPPPQPAVKPAAAKSPTPSEAALKPAEKPSPQTPAPAKKAGRGPGRVVKAMMNWSLLIAFVATLGLGVWYAVQNPRKVWNALDGLPDPVPSLIRAAWEMVRPLETSNSGPRVTDPDKRRSDKLP